MLSDSFAGIAPSSVPMFLLAQAVGGAVGFFLNPLPQAPTRRCRFAER